MIALLQKKSEQHPGYSSFSVTGQDEIGVLRQDVFKLLTQQATGNLSEYMYASSREPGGAVNGRALFEKLCTNPHYYLRRAEAELMAQHNAELTDLIGKDAVLIELTAGPVRSLAEETAVILSQLPKMREQAPQRRVFLCLLNTIGNFPKSNTVPNPYAIEFLRKIRKAMGAGDMLIVGQDCNQNKPSLMRAYDNDDAREWLLNLLQRLRDAAGVEIDPAKVRYYAEWNKSLYCMEMGLEMLENQTIVHDNVYFDMRAGQKLHMWNSHKYPARVFTKLARLAGFESSKIFTREDGLSALHVLTPSA